MRFLTLIYAYYDNPRMLARQYMEWRNYPAELRSRFAIVVVDDASPRWPAADVPRPEELPQHYAIYRVTKDVPWHQDGARNLGATVAGDGWLFMSDMDHLLPGATLRKLLALPDDETLGYTFSRLNATTLKPTRDQLGRPKPHPNTFAVARSAYWKAGGYDEDYCGTYGTDGRFTKRLFSLVHVRHLRDLHIVRFPRDLIADASTTSLVRRGPQNDAAKRLAEERKKRLGRFGKITVLDFEWERVL